MKSSVSVLTGVKKLKLGPLDPPSGKTFKKNLGQNLLIIKALKVSEFGGVAKSIE